MRFARQLLTTYRASGADPPFGDPRRAHGVAMEGYYWRCEARDGTVVIALCGVCRDAAGPWAVSALACDPPPGVGGGAGTGLVEHVHAPVIPDPAQLGIDGGEVLQAGPDRLVVRLGGLGRPGRPGRPGDEAALTLELREPVHWPRRAWGGLGPAHWIPGLGQYWHPHVLGGAATGELQMGGRRVDLAGARVYAEKNWGSAFPGTWWWGQAGGLGGEDATVAFAGGGLGGGVSATAAVLRLGGAVLRFGAPTALVRARADRARWLIQARGGRHTLTVEGHALADPLRLPVPIPAQRRCEPLAHQHLAAAVSVELRRGGRRVFAGQTVRGGLEFGG